MNDYKIYALDFDGTLCKNKWPEIGEPIQPMIDYCIKLREQGHKLILWTCRTDEELKDAVKWCNERGLFFHAVNANLPDEIVKYNNDPRKVGADYFIDDKNLSIDEFLKTPVVNGFTFNLQPYCSYCGDFEADVATTDVTSLSDARKQCIHTVLCKNRDFCERIKENFEKRD